MSGAYMPSDTHRFTNNNLATAAAVLSHIVGHNRRCERVPTDLTDTLYAIMSQHPEAHLPLLFKFTRGQCVKHLKTGGLYIITGMPWELMCEGTGELQYAYRRATLVRLPEGTQAVPRGVQYLRPMREMEDGRFVLP